MKFPKGFAKYILMIALWFRIAFGSSYEEKLMPIASLADLFEKHASRFSLVNEHVV